MHRPIYPFLPCSGPPSRPCLRLHRCPARLRPGLRSALQSVLLVCAAAGGCRAASQVILCAKPHWVSAVRLRWPQKACRDMCCSVRVLWGPCAHLLRWARPFGRSWSPVVAGYHPPCSWAPVRRGWARTWLRARAEKGNYVAIAGQRRHTYIHSDATKGAATDAAGSHELTDGASRLEGTRWGPRLAGRDHLH